MYVQFHKLWQIVPLSRSDGGRYRNFCGPSRRRRFGSPIAVRSCPLGRPRSFLTRGIVTSPTESGAVPFCVRDSTPLGTVTWLVDCADVVAEKY